MRKAFLLLSALLFHSAVLFAQPTGYKPVADDKFFRKNYAKQPKAPSQLKATSGRRRI